MPAGNYPLAIPEPQAVAQGLALQQRVESRVQVVGADQPGALFFGDQATAVRISHGMAIAIHQGDFGAGRDPMLGQGRRELFQGQVGPNHRLVAAAAGEGGADVAGREKDVGLGGDLIGVVLGARKPVAGARVVGFLGVVAAADGAEAGVVEQRLRMQLPGVAVWLDAPDFVGRGFRGLASLFQSLGAQGPDHEKIPIGITHIE